MNNWFYLLLGAVEATMIYLTVRVCLIVWKAWQDRRRVSNWRRRIERISGETWRD
jgi:hypothetical protein